MALSAEKRTEALRILGPMAERIRLDPACLGCRVYQDVQEECVLMLEQVWRDEGDLERHLRSNEYRDVLLLMEMALAPPEVCFRVISRSAGLEAIHRARGTQRRGEETPNKIGFVLGLGVLLAGCAAQEQHAEQQMSEPSNCASAEGDIHVL
jgi:quinol monooxygenase YgiN